VTVKPGLIVCDNYFFAGIYPAEDRLHSSKPGNGRPGLPCWRLHLFKRLKLCRFGSVIDVDCLFYAL